MATTDAVISSNLRYVKTIGIVNNQPKGRGFANPVDVAFTDDGRILVLNRGANFARVGVLTYDEDYLGEFASYGRGEGQFLLPTAMALDGEGNVYVADWRNDRVQKFDAEGRPVAIFGGPGDGDGQFHRPSSVAVDAQGRVYVADWGNERVQVLGPDGAFLQKLRGQATLSKWAREFLESNPDEKETRDMADLWPQLPEHLQTPYHISSQTEPYFWGPVCVRLDPQGRLFVVETNRHRLQVYGQG